MKFRNSQKLFACGLILLVQFICFGQSEKNLASYEKGLSYEKQGKTKDAIKTYERIVNETISTMEFEIENEFAGRSVSPGQEGWKDFIQRKMGADLSIAIQSIGRLKEINSKKAASVEWETKSLILETFAKKAEEIANADDKQPSTTRPVKIINKPTPRFTGSNGTVRLRAMFLSNGKVGLVIPLSRLPGATESAIEATRKITFEPHLKDGKPITVFKIVEYTFHTL